MAPCSVKPQLRGFDFDAGDEAEAAQSRELLGHLLEGAIEADRPCLGVTRTPFDESTLFQGARRSRMEPMKAALVNITSIMDCVGCDRCKLWGKLQIQGIGVALKLLFDDHSTALSRNDVIALVNAFDKLSASVEAVEEMMSGAPLKATPPGEKASQRFPVHWGEPPMDQTRDLRELPGGFGQGSSTLADWIEAKLALDASPSRQSTAQGNVEL